MVTDRYQHVSHHPDVDALAAWASSGGPDGGRLPLIGVDNLPGAVPLEGYALPRECVLRLRAGGAGALGVRARGL